MKRLTLVCVALCVVGCGGPRRVTLDFPLPEADTVLFSDSYYQEGWRLLREGRPDAALKNFRYSSVEEEKQLVGFGYAYLATNKPAEARDVFAKACQLHPGYLAAEIGFALAAEKNNDRRLAFEQYGRILSRDPENAWAKGRWAAIKAAATADYLRQAETQRQGDRVKIIAALEEAAVYSPELVDIQLKIAEYYYQSGTFDRAAAQFQRALESRPDDAAVLIRLAEVYEKQGRLDSALLTWNKLAELRPDDAGIAEKRRLIRDQFQQLQLPQKFKNIFFKAAISREDMAALIGYYFAPYLKMAGEPQIITDIEGSYAREEIIKVCTVGIMQKRPDHSFDRFSRPDRAATAVALDALLTHLEQQGIAVRLQPASAPLEPLDVSPLHKHYAVIKFLVNAQIMDLDAAGRFNPTAEVTPDAMMAALKKILNGI